MEYLCLLIGRSQTVALCIACSVQCHLKTFRNTWLEAAWKLQQQHSGRRNCREPKTLWRGGACRPETGIMMTCVKDIQTRPAGWLCWRTCRNKVFLWPTPQGWMTWPVMRCHSAELDRTRSLQPAELNPTWSAEAVNPGQLKLSTLIFIMCIYFAYFQDYLTKKD